MTLPEATEAYAVFLEGGLSAVELRNFLDQELPEWLDQLDPIMASAVRGAESVSAREYLGRVGRLKSLASCAAPCFTALMSSPRRRYASRRRYWRTLATPTPICASIVALFATRSRSTIWDSALSLCQLVSTRQECRPACN
jgi:hypothetical protein